MRKTIEDRLISDIMLLVLCMPNCMDYGIEVRIYSLALALIFFAYMIGYRIYYGYAQGWKLLLWNLRYCDLCLSFLQKAQDRRTDQMPDFRKYFGHRISSVDEYFVYNPDVCF